MTGQREKSEEIPAGARLRVEYCDVNAEGGFSAACERLVREGVLAIHQVRAVRWRAHRVAFYVEDPTKGDIPLDKKSPFRGGEGGFEELKILSVDYAGQVAMLVGGDPSAYLSTTARTADLSRGLAALVPAAERGKKSFEFGIGEIPATRISTCVSGQVGHVGGRRPLGLVGDKRKVWVCVDRQGALSALPMEALANVRSLASGSPFSRIGDIPITAGSAGDPRWFEKVVWTIVPSGSSLRIHASFQVNGTAREAWIVTDGTDVLERFPVPQPPASTSSRKPTVSIAPVPSRSSSRRP